MRPGTASWPVSSQVNRPSRVHVGCRLDHLWPPLAALRLSFRRALRVPLLTVYQACSGDVAERTRGECDGLPAEVGDGAISVAAVAVARTLRGISGYDSKASRQGSDSPGGNPSPMPVREMPCPVRSSLTSLGAMPLKGGTNEPGRRRRGRITSRLIRARVGPPALRRSLPCTPRSSTSTASAVRTRQGPCPYGKALQTEPCPAATYPPLHRPMPTPPRRVSGPERRRRSSASAARVPLGANSGQSGR